MENIVSCVSFGLSDFFVAMKSGSSTYRETVSDFITWICDTPRHTPVVNQAPCDFVDTGRQYDDLVGLIEQALLEPIN